MAIFTDNFTGSNGDLVSARSGWNKYGSGSTDVAQVNASNQVKFAGAFPDDGAMLGQDPGNVAHFVEARLYANAISSKVAPLLCVRVIDRTEYVGVFYDDGSSIWRLRSQGGGGGLDTWAGAAPNGEVYRVEVTSGHVVTVYKDGVSVYSHDWSGGGFSSAQLTATKVGGYLASFAGALDPVLDDWRSGLISDLGGGGGGGSAIGPLMYYQNLLRRA